MLATFFPRKDPSIDQPIFFDMGTSLGACRSVRICNDVPIFNDIKPYCFLHVSIPRVFLTLGGSAQFCSVLSDQQENIIPLRFLSHKYVVANT